jgi:hypothetical protein
MFLENKPGSLEHANCVLAEADINVRTLTIAENTDFSILRLIVNDVGKANKVLKENGFRVNKIVVVAGEVPDKPGSGGTNVEYLDAFVEKSSEITINNFPL